jgi:hypothetical protein
MILLLELVQGRTVLLWRCQASLTAHAARHDRNHQEQTLGAKIAGETLVGSVESVLARITNRCADASLDNRVP